MAKRNKKQELYPIESLKVIQFASGADFDCTPANPTGKPGSAANAKDALDPIVLFDLDANITTIVITANFVFEAGQYMRELAIIRPRDGVVPRGVTMAGTITVTGSTPVFTTAHATYMLQKTFAADNFSSKLKASYLRNAGLRSALDQEGIDMREKMYNDTAVVTYGEMFKYMDYCIGATVNKVARKPKTRVIEVFFTKRGAPCPLIQEMARRIKTN